MRRHLISALLANYPVLLVFDNFEDNLTLGGAGFLDPATAQLMEQLYRASRRGKVLVTSRYPLPDADAWLASEAPGPLSPAQTGKLVLRLTALSPAGCGGDAGDPAGDRGVTPRMLEYLDAILRQGKARMPDVADRLRRQAKLQELDLDDTGVELDEAVRIALQVGAGDILLKELLALVAEHEGDIETLYQASVFPHPVSVEGLAFCMAGGNEANRLRVRKTRSAVERLVQASLLTRTAEDDVWVHRWTAEIMRSGIEGAAYRNYCRLGGVYLTSRKRTVSEALDAVGLFVAADEFDQAVAQGVGLCRYLTQYGQVTDLVAVARELLGRLPQEHPDYVIFLASEAEALQSLGLSVQAMTNYSRMVETLQQRALANPDRADFQRDLSVSYNKMGDLMRALGKGEQAQTYFQKALEIRERLASQEPDRADFQRDLSVSYNQIGDLMRALGKGEQAQTYFQKALEISERLASQEPDRARFPARPLRLLQPDRRSDARPGKRRAGSDLLPKGTRDCPTAGKPGTGSRRFPARPLRLLQPDRRSDARPGKRRAGLRPTSKRHSRYASGWQARNRIAPISSATSPSPLQPDRRSDARPGKRRAGSDLLPKGTRDCPTAGKPGTGSRRFPARPLRLLQPGRRSDARPGKRRAGLRPTSKRHSRYASGWQARNRIAPISSATSPSPGKEWAI